MTEAKFQSETKYQIESAEPSCRGCSGEIAPGDSYFSAVVFGGELFERQNFCPRCWRETSGTVDASLAEADEVVPGDWFAYWKTRRPVPESGPREKVRFDSELVLGFFRRLRAIVEGASEDARSEGGVSEGGVSEGGVSEGGVSEGGVLEGGALAGGAKESESAAFVAESCSPEAPRHDAGVPEGVDERGDGDSGVARNSDDSFEESSGDDVGAGDPEAEEPVSSLSVSRSRDLRFVLALLLLRKKVLHFEASSVENGREWLRLTEKADPETIHWVENPELSDDELERVKNDIGELLQMKI